MKKTTNSIKFKRFLSKLPKMSMKGLQTEEAFACSSISKNQFFFCKYSYDDDNVPVTTASKELWIDDFHVLAYVVNNHVVEASADIEIDFNYSYMIYLDANELRNKSLKKALYDVMRIKAKNLSARIKREEEELRAMKKALHIR